MFKAFIPPLKQRAFPLFIVELFLVAEEVCVDVTPLDTAYLLRHEIYVVAFVDSERL